MIRKLLLPAVAVALLVGCASGYQYRSGSGDYYHGSPQVEYRYYPSHPYGYGPYRQSYLDRYGRRHYYYSPYYGGPYYDRYYGDRYRYYRGYPYRPPYYRRDDHGHQPPRVDTSPNRPRSPWRDLDRLRDRENDPLGRDDRSGKPARITMPPPPRVVMPPPRPVAVPRPRARSTGGEDSGLSERLRRARERGHEKSGL